MACSSCTDVRVQPAAVHACAAQDFTSIVLHVILGKWYATVSNMFSTSFERELHFHLYAVRDYVDTSEKLPSLRAIEGLTVHDIPYSTKFSRV